MDLYLHANSITQKSTVNKSGREVKSEVDAGADIKEASF